MESFSTRHEFNRPPSFAQCFFFSPEAGIDQTEDAERRAIIWLGLHDLLLLRTNGGERGPRLGFVLHHPRDQTLAERSGEKCCVKV